MTAATLIPTLVTGLLTGLIALAGVIYTQRQATQREDQRWEREGSRQQEDRAWQRELWVRDRRREAYLAFMTEQRRLDHWMTMYTRVGLEGVETPKEDWAETLGRLLLDIHVFGSQEAAVAAGRVVRATEALQSGAVGDMMRSSEALEEYRRLVQRDLGLTETHLPSWEDEDEWRDAEGG